MPPRPNPPLATDDPQGLADHVASQPAEWLLYLRDMNTYTSGIEQELRTVQKKLVASEQRTAETRGVVTFQKELYQEAQDRIVQLEKEKQHALLTGTPAVMTPSNTTETGPAGQPSADLPAGPAPYQNPPSTARRSGSPHLSERQPDPDKFDGSRPDLRRFTQQIYAKMTANADRFPTATTRLTYVAGRLSGKAYDLILPKTLYGVPQFVDYKELLDYLESAFGDPDRVQNAQNKLYQLKQKNTDFSIFLSEFQRLALEGEMPDEALTPLLYQGISRELQDMLLHSPPPSRKFRQFTNHLQSLDNRFRQHQQQAARTGRISAVPRPASYASAATPRNSPAPDQAQRTASPRPTISIPAPDGDPMDLSSSRRPSTRRERGECFRCGSKGHLVATCPEPDTRPRSRLHTARSARNGSPDSYRSVSPPASPPQSLNGASLG